MIADTTFLSDLRAERQGRAVPRALVWLRENRTAQILVTAISVGEIAVMFPSAQDARDYLERYRQLRLTPEIALVAAGIDRELIESGGRLGENDNWIAGFCRYYGQPVISRDVAFDRVRGLRRLAY